MEHKGKFLEDRIGLLTCPFCGGEAVPRKDYELLAKYHELGLSPLFAVGCETYGCVGNKYYTHLYDTKHEAFFQWNMRADTTEEAVKHYGPLSIYSDEMLTLLYKTVEFLKSGKYKTHAVILYEEIHSLLEKIERKGK